MMPTPDRSSEPALLQRMISATLWEIRKATSDQDEPAARRAEREMTELLDQFAGCMIADDGAQAG